MRQTTLMIATAVLGLAAAAHTQAQNGLLVPAATTNWPQWQGRLALNVGPQNLNDSSHLRGSSLLGDYYFFRHTVTSTTSPLGGFRATSGLMFGNTAPRLLTGLGADTTSGFGLRLNRGGLGPLPLGGADDLDYNTTTYFGLGYTLLSQRGGWGLSADIGLASLPRSTALLGLSRSSLEGDLHALRLTPLLQLGLSYSF